VSATALTVVVVYPDLLGTYGDGGNGLVLARRAAWRGVEVELVEADSGGALPVADLYCLGGGEDGPQVRAAEALATDGRLSKAVDVGAAVLAVCAGYQIVGRSFPDASGRARPGLGLLDVTTEKSNRRRAVGEVVAHPLSDGPAGGPLPTMTGFENHGGVTTLGPGAKPLSRVEVGVGNGDGAEGAWSGRVVGTYLHGPVLARNPALADRLLSWVLGRTLDALDDHEEDALRAERLSAARHRGLSARVRRWRGR
jgi:lipid II isoglutaminyl synthase (glutamine-hydrolysing)